MAHLESAAAGPHRLLCARRLGSEPRLKEVEPQLPVGGNAQVPLADGDEDGRLRDGVGVEVVELHIVVMLERPHEQIRRQAKATLVEGHEAHDVAIAWPRLWLVPRSNPLRSIGVGDRAEETIIDERLQRRRRHVRCTPRIRL